jgi:Rpp20 subunit of nuclear RNase MRP and P
MERIHGSVTTFITDCRNGVVVRAMGAAIEKAVCLALELQRRNYAIGIITGTAEVVDDVIPDDNVCRHLNKLMLGYGVG